MTGAKLSNKSLTLNNVVRSLTNAWKERLAEKKKKKEDKLMEQALKAEAAFKASLPPNMDAQIQIFILLSGHKTFALSVCKRSNTQILKQVFSVFESFFPLACRFFP